jgi:ketosteroid isomerase-like protein
MSQRQLDTVRSYLQHLHASHTAGLIATFEDDGVVHSPFLGTMTARDFFPKLAQASSQSVITLIDLFASVQPADDAVRVAAYFRYDWTLSDGRLVNFTCVDVFGFRQGSDRIASMHIVYDTHPLREQVGDKYAPDPVSLPVTPPVSNP